MAVVSGVNSAPVKRLKNTWAALEEADRFVFDGRLLKVSHLRKTNRDNFKALQAVISLEGNFKALRERFQRCIQQQTPCTPYLGSLS